MRLLGSINSEQEQLHSLRMFCAAYMGCSVRQAMMTQADRRGFTLLAEPIEKGTHPPPSRFYTLPCSIRVFLTQIDKPKPKLLTNAT